jgi:hypothetical protein
MYNDFSQLLFSLFLVTGIEGKYDWSARKSCSLISTMYKKKDKWLPKECNLMIKNVIRGEENVIYMNKYNIFLNKISIFNINFFLQTFFFIFLFLDHWHN